MDIFSTCSLCVSDLHRIKFNNVYRVCFDNVIDAEKIIYDIIAKLEQTKGAFLAKGSAFVQIKFIHCVQKWIFFYFSLSCTVGNKDIERLSQHQGRVYIFDASMSMALMPTVQALIRM